jgi:hypothetical protein
MNNRYERIMGECMEAFDLDQAKMDCLTKLLEKMQEGGPIRRSELEKIVGTDADRFARFLDILEFDNPDAESPEELAAGAEHARRIASYLRLNNFKNLEEAGTKGWGDTSPLGSRLFEEVRHLFEASQKEKH